MIVPDYTEARGWCGHYRYIPIAFKVDWPADVDPLEVMRRLAPEMTGAALLESGRAGRYTYLGWNPRAVITSRQGMTTIRRQRGRDETVTGENPLFVLRRFLAEYRTPNITGMPDFSGGAIGFLSYDLNRFIEPTLPQLAKDDLQLPDLYVMIYEDLLIFDHETRTLLRLTHVPSAVFSEKLYRSTAAMLETEALAVAAMVHGEQHGDWEEWRKRPLLGVDAPRVSFTQAQFEQAVRKVQAYIAQGDVFQVNLSIRQSKPLRVRPDEVYAVLRRLNPSPYMGYLHFPDLQLVCGSPELLIKVNGREVSTRPIAGTRPRGRSREEDRALACDLIHNEKERAEHIMLVDLERNDLGRVCRYGSVEVSQFMVIEEYSHVMHIVSHVRGELADDKDAFDAVAAAFPGGTITGAPKVRTMEIIEELEPVKRGVYTGAIGWFGFNGDLELNIAIRTMVAKDGVAHVQSGAGIVIDSQPEAEYLESLKKAEALWKALELSENRKQSQEESRA